MALGSGSWPHNNHHADPLAGLKSEARLPNSEQTTGETAVLLPVVTEQGIGVLRHQLCQCWVAKSPQYALLVLFQNDGQPCTEPGSETWSLRQEARPTAAASSYRRPRTRFEKAARGFGPAGGSSKCQRRSKYHPSRLRPSKYHVAQKRPMSRPESSNLASPALLRLTRSHAGWKA